MKSVIDLADPEVSYSGSSFLGLGLPLVIGASFLHPRRRPDGDLAAGPSDGYFERRGFEAVAPDVAAGGVKVPETAGAPD